MTNEVNDFLRFTKSVRLLQEQSELLQKQSEQLQEQIDAANTTAVKVSQSLAAVMAYVETAFPEAYAEFQKTAEAEKKDGEDA